MGDKIERDTGDELAENGRAPHQDKGENRAVLCQGIAESFIQSSSSRSARPSAT